MPTTFSMKLQSPDYDGAGNGYEMPLPVTQDSYLGDSLAAIIPLFEGNNQLMDFLQFSEAVTLVGVLTQATAADTGTFANAIQMRDEMRRIRGALGDYGRNVGASKSWIAEGVGGGSWTSAALIAAGEADGGTSRKPGTCRLIWDEYYQPSTGTYKKLFLYGTVKTVQFGPRPASTTRNRIPFQIQFVASSVKTGI